ncbi:hypothetical protein [Rhizobium sp. LCM 4573]|uniref:hypothetical protein n=1 Tax=Rhizobium sp. LCM 4573 TaxID=1848291 RepID=UPI0008DA7765|nr:hypothetical protein [Rhizobium sp. LCM 4573]OHV78551.1 hypothetical protein LCM4573_26630 [Rhizobium sp. LCM 4573]
MNKARRKQIEIVKERIAALLAEAEEIRAEVESIRDDEQEYRDAMPDSLADGEKGEKADCAIEALDQVVNDLDSLIENDFESPLDTAAE